MNKLKLITTFLPAFVMLSIALLTFTNIIDSKDLFVIGLLLIFPILYLAQGMACGSGKGNIYISLLVSTITFIIITMLFLNATAHMYLFLYLIVGLFGFGISVFSRKNISKGK